MTMHVERGGRRWWPGTGSTELGGYWTGAGGDDSDDIAGGARGDALGPLEAPGLVAGLRRGSRRGQPLGADARVDDAVPAVTADVVAWPGLRQQLVEGLDGAEASTTQPPAQTGPQRVGVEGPSGVRPLTGVRPVEVEDDDELEPSIGVDDKPQVVSEGVRVRGWAGRGPVGLAMQKPPKWVRRRMERQARRPRWWRWPVAWLRIATGGELDGRPRTDATWWRWGTTAYEWSDRLPPRFAAAPGVLRAGARWAGGAATAGVCWAYLEAPGPTAWSLATSGWVVLAASGWAGADALLRWPHRRRNVWPLHRALAPVLRYGKRTPPRRYLFVPKDYATRGGQVEVALPPDFVSDGSDDRGRKIANVVRRKLRLADVEEVWHDDHDNHFVVFRPTFRQPVPRWCRFDNPEVRRLIESLEPSQILLGRGPGGKPVTFDWDVESPHLFLIEGSGCGKSEDLKSIGAQAMNRGAQGLIFDHKYTSHDGWAMPLERRGLVRVFRSIEEIHRGLVALGQECEERNEAARAASLAGEPPPTFTRLVVLLDEAPTTIKLLRLWWTTHRHDINPDPQAVRAYGDPRWTKSPAEVAIFMALAMGRERMVHVALVSQVADAREIGGGSIRDMFHLRILGRQPQAGWRKGAPEISDPPVCSRHRGRKYVVVEGQVIEIQATYFTDREATAWAFAGHPDDSQPRDLAHTFASRADGREVANDSRATPGSDTAEVLVTLAQASADKGSEIVPYTYQTLRNYSATDPSFPAPAKRAARRGKPHLYDPHGLGQWHAQRTAAKPGSNR